MSLTRAQWRTRVQRIMDSVGSSRWDTTSGTTGEMDQVLGYTFLKEWKRILNANRQFRVNKVQPTTDSNGRVSLAALSTGSGDTQKHFYRVLLFRRNNYVYQQGALEKWEATENYSSSPRIWYIEGQDLMVLPQEISTTLNSTGDGVWVNWVPTAIDALSTDTATVDFPDGYEIVPCYEAAAHLVAKGGAEYDTTVRLKNLAEEARAEMLQDLARYGASPTRFRAEDDRSDWGG